MFTWKWFSARKQRGVTWNLLFPERCFVSMLTLKIQVVMMLKLNPYNDNQRRQVCCRCLQPATFG